MIVEVTDPLVGPAPSGWDDFVTRLGSPPLWRSRLLRTAGWCARTPTSLALVRDAPGGAVVAALHARHLAPRDPRGFVRPGRVAPVTLTECRTLPTYGPGLAFAPDTDDRDRREAVRAFERAIAGRVGVGGRAVAYRGLREDDLVTVPAAGRLRLRDAATMVLSNEWPSVDAYLASIARDWRKRLRRIRRLVDEAGVRTEMVDAVDPDEAGWLAEVVRSRYRSRWLPPPPFPAHYFREFNRLPEAWFITHREPSGRLVAFVAGYDDGTDLHSGIWGNRDPVDGGQRHIYFDNVMRQVELMISRGRRRLVLGAGMAEIKARFGARPQRRWAVIGLR